MRRGFWVGALLVLIVVAIGAGVGAYNVGFDAGLEEAETAGGEVVRVVGDRWGRGGGLFFPFGFLLFPLFFIGIFLLIRAAFWGRHDRGDWAPGPWRGGPPMFEEWHRRQHETASRDHLGSGGEPSASGGGPPGGGGEPSGG